MYYRGIRIGIWVAIFFSLSFPITLYAASPLSITPKLSADWRRDTNFYLAQDIEREVDTYSLHPGIGVGLETAKTTLMLDWLTNSGYEYPVAWVALEESENDPVQFLLYLITALEKIKKDLVFSWQI